MTAREEVESLLADMAASTRIGQVILEQGRDALDERALQFSDLVDAFSSILDSHRGALLLLADKIDSL